MEIAFKILEPENGLDKRRSIDKKIIIDIENKTIIVEGTDYTYYPTGAVISQVPFRYEVDNIPEIKEVIAVEEVISQAEIPEVLDEEGVVVTPMIPAVIGVIGIVGVVGVPANNRFDNMAASPIGQGIAGMIQNTINNL